MIVNAHGTLIAPFIRLSISFSVCHCTLPNLTFFMRTALHMCTDTRSLDEWEQFYRKVLVDLAEQGHCEHRGYERSEGQQHPQRRQQAENKPRPDLQGQTPGVEGAPAHQHMPPSTRSTPAS